METQTKSLADRIKELRDKSGLTQLQLATRAGLSLGAIRNVEQGLRTDPSLSTIRGLANALGVSADKIIG